MLGTPQAAKFGNWIALLNKASTDSGLLRTYGLWGCLLAACLLAKTAKYTVADLNTCVEYALMSAKLFSCLFECDAMHPTRMCDFATYTPSQVWPGVDLFGDRYRYSLSLCHLNPLHYFHVSRTSTFNLSP